MKNFIKRINYSLNNETGGANLQTIFIIGASLAVLMVAYGYRVSTYNWIDRAEKLEYRSYQGGEN